MKHLYTPWRMAYIRGDKKSTQGGCVFCDKHNDTDAVENAIVARSEHVYVTLNIFPYNNGHVMVVPYEHITSQEDMTAEALTDLMLTINKTMAVLREVYHPQGFNIGANIGDAAGAGIAAHYHFHIVPRWHGDSNYMTVVGDTRVIPDTLENTYNDLRAAWQKLFGE